MKIFQKIMGWWGRPKASMDTRLDREELVRLAERRTAILQAMQDIMKYQSAKLEAEGEFKFENSDRWRQKYGLSISRTGRIKNIVGMDLVLNPFFRVMSMEWECWSGDSRMSMTAHIDDTFAQGGSSPISPEIFLRLAHRYLIDELRGYAFNSKEAKVFNHSMFIVDMREYLDHLLGELHAIRQDLSIYCRYEEAPVAHYRMQVGKPH